MDRLPSTPLSLRRYRPADRVGVVVALALLFWLPSPRVYGAPPFDPAVPLTGVVLEEGRGIPIAFAAVTLLDSANTLIDRAATDSEGRFALEVDDPGGYVLLVERLGFVPVRRSLTVTAGIVPRPIEIWLEPKPIEVDSLLVQSERGIILGHLEWVGFYERKSQGFGHFVTPEEIASRWAPSAANLLRSIPGVSIEERPPLPTIWFRGPRGRCAPTLWIDGTSVRTAARMAGTPLDEVISVRDIAGIEIYTGAATTPLQWGGAREGCGALVVWTVHGAGG